MLVFERAGLLFIFNCKSSCFRTCYLCGVLCSSLDFALTVHASQSFVDYRVGIEVPGKYKAVLNSDEKRFGGHDRVSMDSEYFTTPMEWNGRKNWLQVYSPARTVLVLAKVD
jgi:1,4-alpha-glucan branching enzyme